MNYFHILTLIFVVCKVAEVGAIAHWSWWLVLAPSIISIGITVFLLVFFFLIALVTD